MKRNKLLSNTLVIIFIGLFAYYFSKHRADFETLRDLNVLLLIVVATGYLGSIYMSGLFNKIIIVPFNKHISHRESFRVALISAVGNYFGPLLGGTGMRAVYLKRQVGLSYKDFVSTLYGYYIIVFLITAFIGIASLGLLHEHFEDRGFIMLGLFFISVLIGLLAMVYNKKVSPLSKYARKVLGTRAYLIEQLASSWHKISNQPRLIASLIKITLINIVLFTIINYCEFLLIGVKLEAGQLLLYTCLGIFSILISLTPGALGIRESVYLFSASVMGVTSSQILAVALIDRTIQFVVMVLGWGSTSLSNSLPKRDSK